VKLQHEHKTASTNIKRTQPCKRQQLPTGKPTPENFHNGPAGRNTELQETTQNAANTQKSKETYNQNIKAQNTHAAIVISSLAVFHLDNKNSHFVALAFYHLFFLLKDQ